LINVLRGREKGAVQVQDNRGRVSFCRYLGLALFRSSVFSAFVGGCLCHLGPLDAMMVKEGRGIQVVDIVRQKSRRRFASSTDVHKPIELSTLDVIYNSNPSEESSR